MSRGVEEVEVEVEEAVTGRAGEEERVVGA